MNSTDLPPSFAPFVLRSVDGEGRVAACGRFRSLGAAERHAELLETTMPDLVFVVADETPVEVAS